MMQVHLDPDARTDFLAAVEYYEQHEAGLGHRFHKAVQKQLRSIATMPLLFRILKPPLRRCLIPGFPYAIVFTVEPDAILVVAVAHTRRKPGYWQDRT